MFETIPVDRSQATLETEIKAPAIDQELNENKWQALDQSEKPDFSLFSEGMNLFDVFGLNSESEIDPGDLKRKFRQLAFTYHPDKNPDNLAEAERSFKIINQAYTVLNDPKSAAEYAKSVNPKRDTVEPESRTNAKTSDSNYKNYSSNADKSNWYNQAVNQPFSTYAAAKSNSSRSKNSSDKNVLRDNISEALLQYLQELKVIYQPPVQFENEYNSNDFSFGSNYMNQWSIFDEQRENYFNFVRQKQPRMEQFLMVKSIEQCLDSIHMPGKFDAKIIVSILDLEEKLNGIRFKAMLDVLYEHDSFNSPDVVRQMNLEINKQTTQALAQHFLDHLEYYSENSVLADNLSSLCANYSLTNELNKLNLERAAKI
ncbi:MAG: hypothetical protein OHK0017_04370 [Patescibacteria group bacterium]